jgi:hypothetical protein
MYNETQLHQEFIDPSFKAQAARPWSAGPTGGVDRRPTGGRASNPSSDELAGEDDDEEGKEEVPENALEHHGVLPGPNRQTICRAAR